MNAGASRPAFLFSPHNFSHLFMSDHPTIPAPPFKIGDRVTLKIEDIAFGGEGVGRVENFVVFVPFVGLGETVEAEVTELKRSFARTRLVRVLTVSADRVEPRCRYFGQCGGCQYQHLAYPAQLRLKHKQISDLLRRIGGFASAVIEPVEACPQPYGYRNRVMVRSQWNRETQSLVIGYLRADNRLAVDVEECVIAEPALNEQLLQVRANPPPKGGIKVVLRIMPEGWELPRDSFFQNNFFLLPKLIEVVRETLKSAGTKSLIDAYCGVGFFSVELGDLVERFAGIEIDAPAIKAARKNAANRNLTNGEFIAGSTEDVLPALIARFSPPDTTVIIDPPRTGCSPSSIALLRQVRPQQVIYVSCHPATLARDLGALCADGIYAVRRVIPLDMFPQTQHVECVVDVRRAD